MEPIDDLDEPVPYLPVDNPHHHGHRRAEPLDVARVRGALAVFVAVLAAFIVAAALLPH